MLASPVLFLWDDLVTMLVTTTVVLAATQAIGSHFAARVWERAPGLVRALLLIVWMAMAALIGLMGGHWPGMGETLGALLAMLVVGLVTGSVVLAVRRWLRRCGVHSVPLDPGLARGALTLLWALSCIVLGFTILSAAMVLWRLGVVFDASQSLEKRVKLGVLVCAPSLVFVVCALLAAKCDSSRRARAVIVVGLAATNAVHWVLHAVLSTEIRHWLWRLG